MVRKKRDRLNDPHRVFIIAEAGVNHNGSLKIAKELIDVASAAGADAVKFQTFKADRLVSAYEDRAQFEMLKRLELSRGDHEILYKYCKKKKESTN